MTLRIDADVDKATIYVDGKVATTLRDGSAKVVGLDEGVHEVAIEADGFKRYEVRLDRISDPELETNLVERVAKKYGGGPPSDAGVWFFRIFSAVKFPTGRI